MAMNLHLFHFSNNLLSQHKEILVMFALLKHLNTYQFFPKCSHHEFARRLISIGRAVTGNQLRIF